MNLDNDQNVKRCLKILNMFKETKVCITKEACQRCLHRQNPEEGKKFCFKK